MQEKNMPKPKKGKEFAIGINIGTTNSSVGVFLNDKVEIIPNDLGNKTTPSVVAFTENGELIGDSAVYQIAKKSKEHYSWIDEISRK